MLTMCSNYKPVTRLDRLLSFFGAEVDRDVEAKDIWPLQLAPIIRIAESGKRVAQEAQFGLLPHFATEVAYGRRTYNARTETVHKLASFRDAWKRGQRCIVPAECIYEPCWETGKAVRWCIQQPGEVPLGVAGIWTEKRFPDGSMRPSFAMLTVNADGHAVFKRMHRPEDEKRMVVILDPADYEEWLTCSVDEAPKFFRQWLGPLDAFPAPLKRRGGAKKDEDAAGRAEGDDLF